MSLALHYRGPVKNRRKASDLAERKKPLLVRAAQIQEDGTVKETTINAGDMKPGERCRDELPPDLKARVDAVYERVGRSFSKTREDWHDGFCRDQNPDREIGIWERIADVTDDLWASEPKVLQRLNRTSLLRAVLMVASGMVDIPAQVPGITDEGVAVIRAAYAAKT
jgi:hypothetical protein